MSSATVSVVIPCYNQGRFLAEAIESVLRQTRPPAELVVVDDGSTDETAAVARRYPGVRYVRQRNQGLASSRNAGLRRTGGEYLVFLDADDRLRPDALEVGARELDAHPEAALAWGRCVRIDEHGRQLPTAPPPIVVGDAYEALLRNNFLWTPAVVMFRRSMCAPLMRFNPAVDASADYELHLRIARAFPIHGHAATVAEYRLHGASMSRNASLMLVSTMEVLRAQRPYVMRRRSYRRAYEQARRSWRAHYGEQLIEQLARQARNPRRWLEAGAIIAVLARYYPGGLAARVARKLLPRSNPRRQLVQTARGQSTAPPAPPEGVDTAGRGREARGTCGSGR